MSIRGVASPVVNSQRAVEEAYSLIDRFSTVDGSLSTSQDLRIEGRVIGTLHCEGVLFVAQGAEVQADVVADGIVVEGSVSGSIECHGRLEIRASGVVRSEVQTKRLVVHEGAIYEGRLEMNAPDEEAAASEPPSIQQPDAESRPATTNGSSYSFLRSFSGSGSSGEQADVDLPATDDEEDREPQ
jgi:cytoskeletal protein CcmA (bactofilin family)